MPVKFTHEIEKYAVARGEIAPNPLEVEDKPDAWKATEFFVLPGADFIAVRRFVDEFDGGRIVDWSLWRVTPESLRALADALEVRRASDG